MDPALTSLPIEPAAGASQRWRVPLAAWLALLALIGFLFRDSFLAMASIWARSDTFAHCFLVPPISAWLAWRGRARLMPLAPRPWGWALVPLAAACVLWLLGDVASVNAAAQFAAVALVVVSVPLMLGPEVARALAFPLLFLFFAVPFGEVLTDPMMEGTADFTVAALQATGIPVYREGRSFVIPSGSWSVVEACSGIRYLIASFMVGTLFAYLNFASLRRRLVFVAVSLIVPVVANWLRAYIIVMLGHLSGNKLAVGVDHLIYGWLFFGIVITALFVIGARFADSPGVPGPAPRAPAAVRIGTTWPVAAAGLVLLLGTQALAWRAATSPSTGVPVLKLPEQLSDGWTAAPPPAGEWTPLYAGASSQASLVYRRGSEAITVWAGYWRDQGPERKMVTSTNVLVPSESHDWLPVAASSEPVVLAQGRVDFRSATLRAPPNLHLPPQRQLVVHYAYWIDGTVTTSDAQAKLRIAASRLLGRGDDAAVLFFHADVPPDATPARSPLKDFVGAHWAEFAAALERTAGRPQAAGR